MGIIRSGLVAGVAALTLALWACGGDDKPSGAKESADGRDDSGIATKSGGSSGVAPEILSAGSANSAAAAGIGPSGLVAQAPAAGLTVRDTARATVPAETAFAAALYYPRSASGPFPRLSATDESKLRAALTAAGFAPEDISIQNTPQFGPQTFIRVKIPVAGVADGLKKVSDAITESIGRAEQEGVQFGLNSCQAALGPVRAEAFKRAEDRAKLLAEAGKLKLGAVLAVSEAPPSNPYGPPTVDPCANDASSAFKGYPNFLPADAKAEVELAVELAVTYQLGETVPQTSDGLVVVGVGEAKAKADEAYVVVVVEQNGPRGPRPIAQRDRDDIITKLTALGVAKDDIEFVSPPGGGPAVVSVETKKIGELAKVADDISDVVEEVLGQSFNKGVTFTHSNCPVVRDAARSAAVADARSRAKALAAAADMKIEERIQAIAETSVFNQYGPPPVDPCSGDLSQLAYGYGGVLQPFNAPPEFTVQVAVTLTFGLAR